MYYLDELFDVVERFNIAHEGVSKVFIEISQDTLMIELFFYKHHKYNALSPICEFHPLSVFKGNAGVVELERRLQYILDLVEKESKDNT